MDTPLLRFAERTLTHSFCISGMGFQDVWNIDLGRLHGCCVHIINSNCEVIHSAPSTSRQRTAGGSTQTEEV